MNLLNWINRPTSSSNPASSLNTNLPSLDPRSLLALRDLLFAAKLMVDGCFAGQHRSPHLDVSGEFADLRPYAPGDDLRSVDWRAAGKSDRIYTRRHHRETELPATIVVDCSASMGFAGDKGVSKLDYARLAAAGIAFLLARQGDRPAIALSQLGRPMLTPPASSLGGLAGLTHSLERASAEGEQTMASALRWLFPVVKRRGLLVLITDGIEDLEPLFANLGLFRARGFQVLALQVLTAEELNPSGMGVARFFDPETGEFLDADAAAGFPAYDAALDEHLDRLKKGCAARGILHALVTTDTLLNDALRQFLSAPH